MTSRNMWASLALLCLLPACAASPESRQRQVEIALGFVRDQITAWTPLLDEETISYLNTATLVLDTMRQGGEVSWESVNKTLDEVQPLVLEKLASSMSPTEAAIAISSFRTSLRTIELLMIQ